MRAFLAQMAELVDALGSGPSARKGVEVRVLFWAPYKKAGFQPAFFFSSTERGACYHAAGTLSGFPHGFDRISGCTSGPRMLKRIGKIRGLFPNETHFTP